MESLNRFFSPGRYRKNGPQDSFPANRILSHGAQRENSGRDGRGLHHSAVATITEGKPAVRFMALIGYDDLTLIGVTMRDSRKIGQIKKNPDVALSISGPAKNSQTPMSSSRQNAPSMRTLRQKRKTGIPGMNSIFRARKILYLSWNSSHKGLNIIMKTPWRSGGSSKNSPLFQTGRWNNTIGRVRFSPCNYLQSCH